MPSRGHCHDASLYPSHPLLQMPKDPDPRSPRLPLLFSNMRSLSSSVKVLTLHQANWSTLLKVATFKHQRFALDKQAWLSGSSRQCKNVTRWTAIETMNLVFPFLLVKQQLPFRRWMHSVVFMSIAWKVTPPGDCSTADVALIRYWACLLSNGEMLQEEWGNEKTALVLNRADIIEIQACEGWWMNW